MQKGEKMHKGDLNKDGKMSGYEKARSKAIQKAMMKKKRKKTCPKCGGKGCSHCGGKGSHSADTGDGTGAAQGKYKK